MKLNLKMINFKNLIILLFIIDYAQMIQSDDEIFELNCVNETQCKQFETSGIKSSCVKQQCQCTLNGETVKCQPSNFKVSNIIGGPCPCNIPDANCDQQQNICYCIDNYMPSKYKRRCIPKTVALDGKCEETSQCQSGVFNAICNETKKCECQDNFVNVEGHCLSIINDTKTLNLTNSEGIGEYKPDSPYRVEYLQHVCTLGYFASFDNSKCLKVTKYQENCAENIQCMGSMGIGGRCVNNICDCAEKYFVEEREMDTGEKHTVCTSNVDRGHYCHYDEDCHQQELSKAEQTMYCAYGECNCKEGYMANNNTSCFKISDAGYKTLINMHFFFIYFIIVFILK